MPQKEFNFEMQLEVLEPLEIPVEPPLWRHSRVLRLLDVGSKRFLTNKVDRSVTGLVAQQSCVGPLHTLGQQCCHCAVPLGIHTLLIHVHLFMHTQSYDIIWSLLYICVYMNSIKGLLE